MTSWNDKLEAVVQYTSCPPHISMLAVHICHSISYFVIFIEVLMVVLLKILSFLGF